MKSERLIGRVNHAWPWNLIHNWRHKRRMRRLQAERAVALQAFRATLARGDTRGEHSTRPAAIRTTAAQLAAETGYRLRHPQNWRGKH